MQGTAQRSGRIWLTLDAPDVIELKRITLDRDARAAVDFLRGVVAPRVREAARQRGLAYGAEDQAEADERLPG